MSRLKMAFEEARQKNNIGRILPTFMSTTFYVVSINTKGDGQNCDLAMTKGPNKSEMCVTVSEDPILVNFDNWDTMTAGGRELLAMVPKGAGVLVAYKSGRDYITSRQIDEFLGTLD